MKRVNVMCISDVYNDKGELIQSADTIMRTTKRLAIQLVASGNYKFTTKGKLRSFINKTIKLHKTERAIKGIDFKDKKSKHLAVDDPETGKQFVKLYQKEVNELITLPDAIDPSTGKPVSQLVPVPRYQVRVTKFPLR